MQKVYKSAVIIMPPKEQWDQIQAIRKIHDKAFIRWMPHINLLYPFIDEKSFNDNNIKDKIEKGLSSLSPFEIELSDFNQFEHSSKNSTLFTYSPLNNDKIIQLQNKLVSLIPLCNDLNTRSSDNIFHPHLTLGQFKGKTPTNNKIRSLKTTWKPIRWLNDRIYVIRRSDTTPFEIINEIKLGNTSVNNIDDSKTNINNINDNFNKLSLNNKINEQKDEIKNLIKRIINWMKRMQSQNQGLPKSKDKLGRTISKMCYVSSCINWEIIIDNIKTKEFIKLTKNAYKINIKQVSNINEQDYNSYNDNKNIPTNSGNVYISSYSSYNSNSDNDNNISIKIPSVQEQKQMAIDRAILWLKYSSSNDFTIQSFESQFKQLCNFKVYITSSQVIEYLQTLNIITLGDDYESIIYNI